MLGIIIEVRSEDVLNIAILSTREHCQYLKKVLSIDDQKYKLSFIEYDTMWELPGLYRGIWNQYDAFCTTGIFASEIIVRTWEDRQKPLESISAQSSEYYEKYFNLLNENKDLDFGKIITDSQLWLKGTEGEVVLDQIKKPFIFERSRAEILREAPLEKIMMMDEIVRDNAVNLYNSGKIDMVVCRLSTAAQYLKKEKIPYSFVFPKPENANQAIGRLITQLKIQEANNNLPTVIIIRDATGLDGRNPFINMGNINALQKLLEYDKKNNYGMLVQKTAHGVEVYTTKEKVLDITAGYLDCGLQKLFDNSLQVGYGINRDFSGAQRSALEAIQYAKNVGESYLVNEKGHLTKLGSGDNSWRMVEGLNVAQVAEDANLSLDTIQGIIYAVESLGKKELTARELADALDMTTANANRILSSMVDAHLAQASTLRQPPGTRGRPQSIYRIGFIEEI